MKNKSAFLTVMTLFVYYAYMMWQGLLNEGYSFLRLMSLGLIFLGMALMLFSRIKSFVKGISKNFKR